MFIALPFTARLQRARGKAVSINRSTTVTFSAPTDAVLAQILLCGRKKTRIYSGSFLVSGALTVVPGIIGAVFCARGNAANATGLEAAAPVGKPLHRYGQKLGDFGDRCLILPNTNSHGLILMIKPSSVKYFLEIYFHGFGSRKFFIFAASPNP